MTRIYTCLTATERFWRHVQTSDDCWIWTGHRNVQGYGVFNLRPEGGGRHYKQTPAHRFAYELLIGPIPNGLVLDHIECDTRACVNPGHTIPTTNEANMLRGNINAKKTHCDHGHPFSEENTGFKNGWRSCLKCLVVSNKKWNDKPKSLEQVAARRAYQRLYMRQRRKEARRKRK